LANGGQPNALCTITGCYLVNRSSANGLITPDGLARYVDGPGPSGSHLRREEDLWHSDLACTVALSVAVLVAAAAPLRADPVRVDFVIHVLTTFTTFPGHEEVPFDILSLVTVGDVVRGSFAYDTRATRNLNAPCQCFENAGTLMIALPIPFGPASFDLTADTCSMSAGGVPLFADGCCPLLHGTGEPRLYVRKLQCSDLPVADRQLPPPSRHLSRANLLATLR
jgi:hypothetical protein